MLLFADAGRDGDCRDACAARRDVHITVMCTSAARRALATAAREADVVLVQKRLPSFFEALGETLTVAETAELVRLVDRDDDGLVDFDEFFDLATRSAQFVDADAFSGVLQQGAPLLYAHHKDVESFVPYSLSRTMSLQVWASTPVLMSCDVQAMTG